jgi:D-alanyl-D-alanine endopeptidase (penicillin-binding protein 7)
MLKFCSTFLVTCLLSCVALAQAAGQAADQTSGSQATTPSKKVASASTKSKSKKRNTKKAIDDPDKPSIGDMQGLQYTEDSLDLKSNAALVIDQEDSKVLFEKNASVSLPIASITKLMTSLVVLEANQDMDEMIEVTNADIDLEKGTGSRLRIGSKLKRSDMLHIALMSSENRAASALGRNYPGGLEACVAAMNAKAESLGMLETHYVDSTGLSSQNVASAQDLARLVNAASAQPLIRQYSTDTSYSVHPGRGRLDYHSSNRLTSSSDWNIALQKTGYISEAGRCLVMEAVIKGRAVVMVFLDSKGKYTRFADAGRIRSWIESFKPQAIDNLATR